MSSEIIIPKLVIEADSEKLAIDSNFEAFEYTVSEKINAFNAELETEEDFAQAKADVKTLKETKAVLKTSKEEFLKALGPIYEVIDGMTALEKKTSTKSLEIDKLIKKRRADKIAGYLLDALGTIPESLSSSSGRIEAAMKGKKTFASLESAAQAEASKITEEIQAVDAILSEFEEALRHGRNDLISKSADAVRSEMERRKQAQEAAIREAKLKEEADKLKAEAVAKQQAEREAEVKNIVQEEKAKKEEENKSSGVAPEPFGAPPKVDSIPVGSEPEREETAAEELARFRAVVIEALPPIKAGRAALKHQENIEIGEEFAVALMVGFKKLG